MPRKSKATFWNKLTEEDPKPYAPTVYLEPTDEGAFMDFPAPREKPAHMADSVLCPKCHGHGGWNLKLNAYPLHSYADTPENRHRYSHFRASCSQCNGWGWTEADNVDCIHDYAPHRTLAAYTHESKCTKCGHTVVYDSSD